MAKKKTDKPEQSNKHEAVEATQPVVAAPTPVPSTENEHLAFALQRGPQGWSLVKYKIQDGKVLSETVGNPNMKAIAEEDFKISFVRDLLWADERKNDAIRKKL